LTPSIQQKAAAYSTPYKFTSKELDEETGLYYFGARYYDPSVGIFHGVDVMIDQMPNWSSFAFVFNNPVKLIDPTGMYPEEGNPPNFKLLNMEFYNPQGEIVFPTAVIMPMNLDDHNGAMKDRFQEAMDMKLPIIQVADLNSLKDAFDAMSKNGITANSYLFVGHGSNGTFNIGDQRFYEGKNNDFSSLSENLKGKYCVFTHCNITKNGSGISLIQKFSGDTKSKTIMSDHLGWSLKDLSGYNWTIPKIRKGDGNRRNDWHMSINGGTSRAIFDVEMNFSTGYPSYTTFDRLKGF
jgi:RHS repeat-associated protein